MTIICRPVGRGNWHVMRLYVDIGGILGQVRINDRFELGGITWRVSEVHE